MADDIQMPQVPETSAADTEAAFQQAFTPQQVIPSPVAPPDEAVSSGPINVINPEGKLVSIPGEHLHEAIAAGYRPAQDSDIHAYQHHEKYGSASQQAITGLEGAARGASFGLSTGLETGLGVKPEDIRGREEENPLSSSVGNVAGLVGSAFIPVVGEAKLLGAAGEGAAAALGLGAKGAGFINQVGAQAVKGAFETALFQGSEEVSKMFAEDPHQSAETAMSNIGMSAVLGGLFGGALGAASQGLKKALGSTAEATGAATGAGATATSAETPGKFVSELDRPAFEAGDFKATIENSDLLKPAERKGILAGLESEKPNAKEIRGAADRLGAPVMEGMVSDSKLVQKAEDSLINGAPTYSGLKRQALYNEGYAKASAAAENALGAGSQMTKAELGNAFKDTISAELKAQNEPIKALYDSIKTHTEAIPLAEDMASKVAQEIKNIPELRVSPSSPEGQLIKRVEAEIGNLKTVDDAKVYKSTLNYDPKADANSNRIRAILRDKLNDLEEHSIEGFAKSSAVQPAEKEIVDGLINSRKEASKMYRAQMEKVGTLAKQLGKGRVHGVQDALNFIDHLPPETVSNRLFSKNNSEFLQFFEKNFPEQMGQMRDYQKGIMREEASRTGEFSAKTFFNKVNKLEPEIRKALFSPEELQALKDSETYIRAMPKDFNPSGTSGMSAFREFFNHPTGALIANARDYGIEKFIKMVSAAPEVKQATTLAKATIDGEKKSKSAAEAVFKADKDSGIKTPTEAQRGKLSKLIDKYIGDPSKMIDIGANNPVPEYSTAFAAAGARAVQYLSSIKPSETPKAPLDPIPQPSMSQKAAYNRALNMAEQPLLALKMIKDGTLTSQDIVNLKNLYPTLYTKFAKHLGEQMVDVLSKGKPIPMSTKTSLSLFLGQPLDSSLTPASIIAAQPKPQQSPGPQQGQPKGHPSAPGLQKLPGMYQTPEQSREQHKLK